MSSLVLLLDISGSMAPQACGMVKSVNNLLSCMQKELAEHDISVKIYTFNDKRNLILDTKLSDTPAITEAQYKTDGSTALFDCLGQTLNEVPDGGMFVVATDGNDNASVEYTTKTVKVIVEEAKAKRNIKFTFLAQGPDAFNCGEGIGLTQGRGTQSYRVDDIAQAMGTGEFVNECCAMMTSGSKKSKLLPDEDDEL